MNREPKKNILEEIMIPYTYTTQLMDREVALGSAVLLLNGALLRLSSAITQKDTIRIFQERTYTNQVMSVYKHSREKAPRDSIVTLQWRNVGDECLKELSIVAERASTLLGPLHIVQES